MFLPVLPTSKAEGHNYKSDQRIDVHLGRSNNKMAPQQK